MRRIRAVVSDASLSKDLAELKGELTGTFTSQLDEYVRGSQDPADPNRRPMWFSFEYLEDGMGYLMDWRERWFRGTGVKPPGW